MAIAQMACEANSAEEEIDALKTDLQKETVKAFKLQQDSDSRQRQLVSVVIAGPLSMLHQAVDEFCNHRMKL